mgnify:FL=1|tara:strand:+ start:1915 stop:2904 length:990 start_codon:yes stop_codon:yes gene_type:complete
MTAPPTVMVTVYGQPKKKKTSDALAAFPTALCIGVPSAVTLVAQNELGFTPAVHPTPPQTLPEVAQLLYQLRDSGVAQQYGAIILDDTSHICQRSMMAWEAEAPSGRSGKKDRFYQYQQLNKHLLEIAALSRHLGVHMVMTFHERMAGTNSNGQHCPGGPDVPSRNQTMTVPSWCDINVRAMVDPGYPDPWFAGIYYCDPTDPDWVTGDRTGVCYEQTPGNLREILRASQSNYRLDRLPSLEWQDDVADKVATAIVEGADVREAVQSVVTAKHQEKKSSQLQLRWACQDGIARGVLSIRQSRNLFDFQVDSPGPVEASVSTPPPPPMNK